MPVEKKADTEEPKVKVRFLRDSFGIKENSTRTVDQETADRLVGDGHAVLAEA